MQTKAWWLVELFVTLRADNRLETIEITLFDRPPIGLSRDRFLRCSGPSFAPIQARP